MVCCIDKLRVLHIGNKACIDLSLNSLDTEFKAFNDSQFIVYVIFRWKLKILSLVIV